MPTGNGVREWYPIPIPNPARPDGEYVFPVCIHTGRKIFLIP